MKNRFIEVLDFIRDERSESIYKTIKDLYDTENGTIYRNNINTEIPLYIKQLAEDTIDNSESFLFNGSVGQTNISFVPHNAILSKELTRSTQKGVYLVFLYAADGSKFYLSLGQGITHIKQLAREEGGIRPNELARIFSKHYREQLNSVGVNTAKYLFDIDLASKADLPKGYESANILALEYDRNNLDTLESDLIELLKIYQIFIDEGLYQYTYDYMTIEVQKDFEDSIIEEFRIGKKKNKNKHSNPERSLSGIQEAKNEKGNRAEKKSLNILSEILGPDNVMNKSDVSVGYDIKVLNNKKFKGIEVKNISQKNRSCFYISGNESDKLERGISRLMLVDNNQFYLSKDINQTTHLKKIIDYFNNQYLYDPDKWDDTPYTLECDSIEICFHSPSFYEDFISFSSLKRSGELTKEYLISFLNIK